MKRLFVIAMTVVAFSCDPEVSPKVAPDSAISAGTVTVSNGRIVFTDTKSYVETLTALGEMDEKSLNTWESAHQIMSLRKYFKEFAGIDQQTPLKHADLLEAPNAILAVTNIDGELQIGNRIMWYNEGMLHSVDNMDEAVLKKIKDDPSISKTHGRYFIQPVGKQSADAQARANLNHDNGYYLDHMRQHNYRGDPNSERRFINRLQAFIQEMESFPGGFDTYSTLYLNLFCQWYGHSSGEWKLTNDARYIEVNITATNMQYFSSGSLVFPFTPANTAVNTSYSTAGHPQIQLATAAGPTYYGYEDTIRWEVDVNGYIYNWLYGDFNSNDWMNAGYPLW